MFSIHEIGFLFMLFAKPNFNSILVEMSKCCNAFLTDIERFNFCVKMARVMFKETMHHNRKRNVC